MPSVALRLVAPSLPVLLAACAAGAPEAPAAGPAARQVAAADLAIAEATSVTSGPLLSGSLVAVRQSTLRAELAAPVRHVAVRVGERVRRGQLLVELALPPVDAAARAAAAADRAALLQLEQAEAERRRTDALVAVGGASRREAEAAAATLDAARAQAAEAVSRQEAARADLARLRIRAPFDGVVAERSIHPGDAVQPGDPLLLLVDPSSLELDAALPATDLGAVRTGQVVALQVSGYPGRRVEGRVARIAPMVDPLTRQLRVVVAIPDAGGTLAVGAFAEGRLALAAREGITVPAAALDSTGGTVAVARVRDGRVERREVVPGLLDATTGRVEIRAGLGAGDTVLVGPVRTLAGGQALAIRE